MGQTSGRHRSCFRCRGIRHWGFRFPPECHRLTSSVSLRNGMSVQCRRYGGIAEAQMQRKKIRCICVAAKARNGSKNRRNPLRIDRLVHLLLCRAPFETVHQRPQSIFGETLCNPFSSAIFDAVFITAFFATRMYPASHFNSALTLKSHLK